MFAALLNLFFLAQTTTTSSSDSGGGAAALLVWCCVGILAIFIIACMWVIYGKAGKPGWAAIIPIYNLIVWMEITGRPVWWIILLFIPFVNIIVQILMYIDLAKSFGKSEAFGCGMIVLPIIFFPLLAFGDAQYVGPVAS